MDGDRRDKDVRGDSLMSRRRFAVRGGALLALLGTVFMVFTASAAAAAMITLTPASATNVVGQQHCVTATVTGAIFQPFGIVFTAAPTSGSTAAPVPNYALVPAVNGQATQFCFTSATPGDVLITAVAVGTGTSSRPTATATKTFIPASCDQPGQHEGNQPGQCGHKDGQAAARL